MPPKFFNRSFFGCGDEPAIYSGHCEKKSIGRRSRVSVNHKGVCSYLPFGPESLSIRSADLGAPQTRRSFKSANEELSVFHFPPPPRYFSIRVRDRDRKLTEVWCYGGGDFPASFMSALGSDSRDDLWNSPSAVPYVVDMQ
jgi:hypothetical protein